MKTIRNQFATIVILTVALTACDDSRARRHGSPEASGGSQAVYDHIAERAKTLGPEYSKLCNASPANFERIRNSLNTQELEAVMDISSALRYYVEVIEQEPASEVASIANSEIVKHQNFIWQGSTLRLRWHQARQRIPKNNPAVDQQSDRQIIKNPLGIRICGGRL